MKKLITGAFGLAIAAVVLDTSVCLEAGYLWARS